MSDSSRHSLYAIAEATYGVTPASPAFSTLRHTAASLALTKASMQSEELRADRQIVDFRHGHKQTAGDISTELSYGSFDQLLEAVTLGSWAVKAAPYSAGTISAAAADNSINDSANGLPILDPGDRVTIAGFTGASTTANQAKLVVVSSTAAKMVLSGGVAFINDAAGETVTVTTLTNRLKAGTTRRSFSVLRQFADQVTGGDNPYHLLTGVEMNKLTITAAAEAIIKAVFSTIGQGLTLSDTAPAGATYVAANSNPTMDSFTGTIKEGGALIATLTELQVTMENGITPRFVVGNDTTIHPSVGRSNLTGQATSYFENASLYKKFVNQTESSLDFTATDSLGNSVRIYLPRIKYSGGQPDTQGQGPITIALPFQALMDATLLTNIIIDRNAA